MDPKEVDMPRAITLIGSAGDGQVDTAAVSVTISQQVPSCVLK